VTGTAICIAKDSEESLKSCYLFLFLQSKVINLTQIQNFSDNEVIAWVISGGGFVRLISTKLAQRLIWAFDPRPDRGRPTQSWLVGPRRAAI